MMKLALIIWVWTQTFYLLFAVFAAYKAAKDAGRYIPWPMYVLIGPPIVAGYLIDVAWNTVLGSLLFWEVPWAESANPLTWTFTGRLKRWKLDPSWRGREEQLWNSIINPLAPGHI
jgi:hypothetical protein